MGEDKDMNIFKESAQEDSQGQAEETRTIPKECEKLLAEKDEELQKMQERILRLAAEMENTRKRLEREKKESINFANDMLIRELIPVLDNLDRTIQHARHETDHDTLLEGVCMTRKGFLDALSKFDCVPFEATGKIFDPNYHEAVMQQEAPGQEDKTVIEEIQKGYMLRDRVLRPAVVIVARNPKAG